MNRTARPCARLRALRSHGLLQTVDEQAAVGQPGQEIVEGQVLDFVVPPPCVR